MQEFKPLHRLLEPDPTMQLFSYPDPNSGVLYPWSLEEAHRRVSQLAVDDNVPEHVRSYFNTAKNALVFSYYHYGFVAVSSFLAVTAVEMALRTRYAADLNGTRKHSKPSFAVLLGRAIDEGRVTDDGFPWLRETRLASERLWREVERGTGKRVLLDRKAYVQGLRKSLPDVRNYFAHPSTAHTLITFEMAFATVRSCAGVINQLFSQRAEKD